MRIGLRLSEGGNDVQAALAQAVRAEELGFDSVFLGEHHGYRDYWPSPQLVLAAISQATTRVKLGTNILLLPLADPIRLAGEFALLDRLSNGRVILGVGVGWDRLEYDRLGASFSDRGKRANEMLELMAALWAGEEVDHDGDFWKISEFKLSPAPASSASIELWVGGRSQAAHHRAARFGEAWAADAALTVEELVEGYASVDAHRAALGLPQRATASLNPPRHPRRLRSGGTEGGGRVLHEGLRRSSSAGKSNGCG